MWGLWGEGDLSLGGIFRRPRNTKAAHLRGFFIWWAHTDLNRGPKDYELPRNAANPVKSCVA